MTIPVGNDKQEAVPYTVKPGDTLYRLSVNFNVDLKDLLEMNPGVSPENFQVGMTVLIPPSNNANKENDKPETVYEKSEANGLREDAASFDEDEEALAERLNDIAAALDKMSESKILVVFNDVPELTYDIWDRYKVGYHDYDVHQFEIGLKK